MDKFNVFECDSLNCDKGYKTAEDRQNIAHERYIVNDNPDNYDKKPNSVGKFKDTKNIALDTKYFNYSDGFGVNKNETLKEREDTGKLSKFKGPHQLFMKTFISSPKPTTPKTRHSVTRHDFYS